MIDPWRFPYVKYIPDDDAIDGDSACQSDDRDLLREITGRGTVGGGGYNRGTKFRLVLIILFKPSGRNRMIQ